MHFGGVWECDSLLSYKHICSCFRLQWRPTGSHLSLRHFPWVKDLCLGQGEPALKISVSFSPLILSSIDVYQRTCRTREEAIQEVIQWLQNPCWNESLSVLQMSVHYLCYIRFGMFSLLHRLIVSTPKELGDRAVWRECRKDLHSDPLNFSIRLGRVYGDKVEAGSGGG